MPSPLAHASLALLAPDGIDPRRALSTSNRVLLTGLVAAVLVLPDVDFAFMVLGLSDRFGGHGTWSHSLAWALPVGLGFALLARLLFEPATRPAFIKLWVIGTAAFATHILMDWANWGFGEARGVMVLWPIDLARYKSPVPLFVGAKWSEPTNIAAHAMTLTSELTFAALVYLLARWRSRRRIHTPEVTAA